MKLGRAIMFAKNMKAMVAFYQEVNTTLSELWRKEGRHAFLHHLNALFGYEPLIYYEKRMLTF